MRYLVAVAAVCFFVSIISLVYAEGQIDYYCKTECLGRGRTMAQCNSLCAITDSSGNPNKNTDCVSTCLKEKGWTRYNCYSECQRQEDDAAK